MSENDIPYNCPLAASISVEPDKSFIEDEEHFNAAELGTTLKITGIAEGGSKEGYTYAFYYKKTDAEKWSCRQKFSEADTTTITPVEAGEYQICIKIKDENNQVSKKYFTLTVNDVELI